LSRKVERQMDVMLVGLADGQVLIARYLAI
jgi:hypothetical protein